jgi:ferredoxin
LHPERLKKIITETLPQVEAVVCYRQGFDAVHAVPFFITSPEQIDQAILNPLCVHNLAAYLPSLKKKKVAVVVKGCDSRTVVQYMQEGLIDRNNVVVIGVPCKGVVNVSRLVKAVNGEQVTSVVFEADGKVKVTTPSGEKAFALKDVCPDKCRTCLYPTPVVYDHLAGDPVAPDAPPDAVHQQVAEIEGMSLEQRLAFWKKEVDRCIRCYACRNACPMCVCQDSCIVETRSPHWMSQNASVDEKLMFHLIHAVHLAGRCVECGECERACPMDIPVATMKRKINRDMKALFGYEPGVKIDEKPPMYVFNVDEATIKEHKLS